MPCSVCQCAADATAHAIVAALAVDDVDRAFELGLIDAEACAGCAPPCQAMLLAARDERRRALAARERYRARNARLQQRARERVARRDAAPQAASTIASPDAPKPAALPSAAAAALARAREKAAARHKP